MANSKRQKYCAPFHRLESKTMDLDTPLEVYRFNVRRQAAKGASEKVITNGADQASVVIESLFDQAEREVCILTEDLVSSMYGTEEVIEAATKFVRFEQGIVRVIAERPRRVRYWQNNPLVRAIGSEEGFVLREMHNLPSVPIDFHFAVADRVHGRYEVDRAGVLGMGFFSNAPVAARLISVFEYLWSDEFTRPTSFFDEDVVDYDVEPGSVSA